MDEKEIEVIIKKPLSRILTDLNNAVTREGYLELEETLKQVYKTIRGSLKLKESN